MATALDLKTKAKRATADQIHAGGIGSITRQLPVSLTATNYIAQYSSGSAIADTSGPWTTFAPTRLPQVVVGGSGVETVFTLVGTRITTGDSFSQTVTATASGGTFKFSEPVATITSFSSDVDPQDTVDLQAGDTIVFPATREIIVETGGNLVHQLDEDDAVATIPMPAGAFPRAVKRINITSTTATGLTLGW